MTDNQLTLAVLKGIRSDFKELGVRMDQRFEAMDKRFEAMDQHFEVIEHTLRDLSEQMVMHSRALKTLLERRGSVDVRLDAHEKRLARLERRLG